MWLLLGVFELAGSEIDGLVCAREFALVGTIAREVDQAPKRLPP